MISGMTAQPDCPTFSSIKAGIKRFGLACRGILQAQVGHQHLSGARLPARRPALAALASSLVYPYREQAASVSRG